MFVDPTRGRSQGFALVAAGVLALGACNDPEQNTDLRPEGPPEVLAVLVMNDAAGQVVEQATYCKVGDEKRPARVGLPDFTARDICPADLSKGADELTDAAPDAWYIRIMFDELLDPNIEDLEDVLDDDGNPTGVQSGTLANTQPVKLECESIAGGFVEVPYDGYYSPSGNNVTWPLGPSLVIKPLDPKTVATGKQCRITINDNVTDKDGNKVPDADRAPGKFTFKIAPIQVIAIDPSDDPMGESPIDAATVWNDNFSITFNTEIDPSSLCDDGPGADECEFSILPEDTGICRTSGAYCVMSMNGADCGGAGDVCEPGGYYAYSLVPFGLTPADFGAGPNAALLTEHEYTFAFKQGAMIKDRCGVVTTFGAPSADNLTSVHFATNPMKLNKANIGAGDLVSPMKKLDLPFSNVVDVASLSLGSDITVSPALANASLTTTTGVDILLAGDYALDTTYTVTLKAGTTVADVYGAEATLAADKVFTFKTQPAVTVTTTADKASVTRSSTGTTTAIALTFNQSMTAASLVPGTDYTLVDKNGAAVVSTVSVGAGPVGFPGGGAACSPTSTSCQLRIRVANAALPPGDYTFTLKMGADVTGVLGATYTAPADKVIHITVKDPTPVTPIQCL